LTIKRIFFITGITFSFILIVFMTYYAVTKVHNTSDPVYAKKIVLTVFFINLLLFANSVYLYFKLKNISHKKR